MTSEEVKAQAIESDYDARNQDNMGVFGNTGQVVSAAEAYAGAEKTEHEAKADEIRVNEVPDIA